MANVTSRRTVLKGSLAAAGLGLLGIPEWAMPVLAQGETVVPFTDIPANFATNPSEVVRVLDIRTISGALTPKDQFFTTQHYGHPAIDPAAFRLKISGLVERPEASAGRGVLESARAALLREVHEVMLRAAATRTPPLDARG